MPRHLPILPKGIPYAEQSSKGDFDMKKLFTRLCQFVQSDRGYNPEAFRHARRLGPHFTVQYELIRGSSIEGKVVDQVDMVSVRFNDEQGKPTGRFLIDVERDYVKGQPAEYGTGYQLDPASLLSLRRALTRN